MLLEVKNLYFNYQTDKTLFQNLNLTLSVDIQPFKIMYYENVSFYHINSVFIFRMHL